MDIENVLAPNKIFFDEKDYKYFICYFYDDYKNKPLHIMLTKTRAHVKRYDGQTKSMYFLIEDDKLLKKYNTIRNKVSTDIKKEFDSEQVYNEKFLKSKIKSYDDEAADFHDEEIPKVGSGYTCLAVITIDSALRKDENYYPQLILKECKYFEKEEIWHIIGDPERSFHYLKYKHIFRCAGLFFDL